MSEGGRPYFKLKGTVKPWDFRLFRRGLMFFKVSLSLAAFSRMELYISIVFSLNSKSSFKASSMTAGIL